MKRLSSIFIQDDFFPKQELQVITNDVLKADYTVPNQDRVKTFDGVYWHNHYLPDKCEVKDLIQKLIKKYFDWNVKENTHESVYTMVGVSDKARPHADGSKAQCLIYVLGDEKINNGTGFYNKKSDNEYELSSMIGFKQIRAIFFTGGIVHSPMHWNAKEGESSWRYSICNFFD